MDLRLKTVTEGIEAYQKATKMCCKRKVTVNLDEMESDVQQFCEAMLQQYHNVWCELGLTSPEQIGHVVAIHFGKLANRFCCDKTGLGRVTTESLVVLYDVIAYYIHAEVISEKSITDRVQRSILQEYDYVGVTSEDLEKLKAIIAYVEYSNYFEVYNLDNQNIFDECLAFCKENISKRKSLVPTWSLYKDGTVLCTDNALLNDPRFAYYFCDKNKDIYVYRPINYTAQRLQKVCSKLLFKDTETADIDLLKNALFYLGATERVVGHYADTICSSAPQRYNGVMRRVLQRFIKHKKDFYKEIYLEKVHKYVYAHIGCLVDYLKTIPNLTLNIITTDYIIFSVNPNTELSTCLSADIVQDSYKLNAITADNFVDYVF